MPSSGIAKQNGKYAGFLFLYASIAKTATSETHLYATESRTSFATGICFTHTNQYSINGRGNMAVPIAVDTTNGDSVVVQGWSVTAVEVSFSYRYYLFGYNA